ncbi:hypothetical protein OE88DRAFT_782786 [Heliocybe sulcata]|uniref:Uncharacterized protein n=1 Tax=Heliocybe sulcata TaxID=5364 RepID=A0A5C3MRI7_9AGAM|nr:hypothetical protein OE88DRAFT_782786 [Heliocybe sulcata]
MCRLRRRRQRRSAAAALHIERPATAYGTIRSVCRARSELRKSQEITEKSIETRISLVARRRGYAHYRTERGNLRKWPENVFSALRDT